MKAKIDRNEQKKRREAKTPALFLFHGTFHEPSGSCLRKLYLPQQNLYFLPEPQGHGSFLPIFFPFTIVPDFF